MVALGQMASGLAHEVNNPLAVINGSILVLEKKIQDGVTDKNALVNLINKIERMSKRIEYIVKSFQQFSRRRPVEELEITTVEEVTMGIRHFVVDKEQTTKVRFDLDYEQSLAIPFRCFKSQVLLATNHLIQNAVQACNGLSEPIVKIKIQATGQHFTFTIQDNGPGVPEHLTSKIMEPFFTTRVIGEGAGLGLSIVLGIAQQHHGELYLDRAQSNSCFVFRVPLMPN